MQAAQTKKGILRSTLLVLFLFLGPAERAVSPIPSRPAEAAPAHALPSPGDLPLSFELNQGQADARVKYIARGPGYTVFLTSRAAVFKMLPPAGGRLHKPDPRFAGRRNPPPVLLVELLGANPDQRIQGVSPLPGKVHYFIGKDPVGWHSSIPTYAKVRYENAYPGIDLYYYGKGRKLEWDFLVSPHAEPERIRLRFEGAQKLRLEPEGDLVLRAGGEEIRLKKPVIYQEARASRKQIDGGYVMLEGGGIGFRVGSYDRERPLVIDPLLDYSGYLGGWGSDFVNAVAVDPLANVYFAGISNSIDFPTGEGADPPPASEPYAYVAKLNPTGTTLLYVAFIAGGGRFEGFEQLGLAVDPAGNAYLAGQTASTTFPTRNALQPDFGGGERDGFVTKLAPSGSELVYSTYIGGSETDKARGIAADPTGYAYVIGFTNSPDFPTANALQPALAGDRDAFVAKINPAGSDFTYSTYLGGAGTEYGYDIATSPDGCAYVTGFTASPDFPNVNPLQPGFGGGTSDAFLAKLDSDGSTLLHSSHLGGSGNEEGLGIVVGQMNDAYVTGWTSSEDFPTQNPLQAEFAGGFSDAFVARIFPTGSSLIFSTYLGGSDADYGYDIALDRIGRAYVTGSTASPDFPVEGAVQASLEGAFDAFVAAIDSLGSEKIYATYLGGTDEENPFGTSHGIAVDKFGMAYVGGTTLSPDFPLANPLYGTPSGTLDGYIAKVCSGPEVIVHLAEGASQPVLTVSFHNGAPHAERLEAKVWIDAPEIVTDLDGDGMTDPQDNCVLSANPLQEDVDADLVGNSCDCDFDQDALCGIADLSVLMECFGSPAGGNGGPAEDPSCGESDQDANGLVGFSDIVLFLEGFGAAPGPSGPGCGDGAAAGIVQCHTSDLLSLLGDDPVALDLGPDSVIEVISNEPLSQALPFPGTLVGARLLDPVTGEIVSESICSSLPCN